MLRWDPKDFGGLEMIRIPCSRKAQQKQNVYEYKSIKKEMFFYPLQEYGYRTLFCTTSSNFCLTSSFLHAFALSCAFVSLKSRPE